MSAAWTKESESFLKENWGYRSIPVISKKINKSEYAILNKVYRLGLGPFLESGDYITVNQLFVAVGRGNGATYTKEKWKKLGLPVIKKKVRNYSFEVIRIDDFWKWAQEYRMHIDFSKFPEYTLGAEPEWVKDQRKADIEFAKYKTTPWTSEEIALLESLLKSYKYTYKELSFKLLRTESSIKRRIYTSKIKYWPIREPVNSKWTEEQENTVIEMYKKGYRSAVIAEYIEKSEQAINGKIERLIKNGKLKQWK